MLSEDKKYQIIENMKYKKYFNLNKIEKDLLDNYDTDLNTCNKCEHLNSFKACKVCNCFMPLKARLKRATCPKNKWEK